MPAELITGDLLAILGYTRSPVCKASTLLNTTWKFWREIEVTLTKTKEKKKGGTESIESS